MSSSGPGRTSRAASPRARARSARWQRPAGVVLALVLGGVVAAAVRQAADAGGLAGGETLFDGRAALVARIGGHSDPLPAAMVACANCHVPRPQPAGVALSADAAAAVAGQADAAGRAAVALASPGPRLHRELLLEPMQRRGGPPSRYDRSAFCRTLQTGEDPAGVVLPRAMPRYEIDPATCTALWRFVTRS